MEILLVLLAIPFLIAVFSKLVLHQSITLQEFFLQLVITMSFTGILYLIGNTYQTTDTEIHNGYVISKSVDKGHYLDPYDCRCRNVCSGSGEYRTCSRVCQTCYEDRYTKTWSAKTSVGNFNFKHVDRSSKSSAWNEPDPIEYINCKQGEPASREKTFTNYVKAVPDSLFNNKTLMSDPSSVIIPEYPRVYDFYKINRVLNPNNIDVDTATLNTLLNESLKQLGKEKQVNIIVILTSYEFPDYRFLVENEWLGGKKNDVVLFLGLHETKILWVDVMTWALNSDNENFVIALRDDLKIKGVYDPQFIKDSLYTNIMALYDRPEMSDYEYLKDDFSPPTWLIIMIIILNIVGGLALTYVFNRVE